MLIRVGYEITLQCVMAKGRDATDVAITTTFGPSRLVNFKVITEEVVAAPRRRAA